MSGFSPEWLALREPVDHRSRDPKLAARVVQHLAANSESRIVDLGCGTGSNLRALAPQLGPRQSWTLVDYDARLLTAARDRLLAWADGTTDCRVGVILHKNDREIAVRFRQADLVRDLDAALGEAADLITASALFDLCSTQFIERFAEAVAARRAAFYTVLTYDVAARAPRRRRDAAGFHRPPENRQGFRHLRRPRCAIEPRQRLPHRRLHGRGSGYALAPRPRRQ